MLAYRINPNGTPGEVIELPDDTTAIAADMTFNTPPVPSADHFVVFDHASRSWSITETEPSILPIPPSRVITVLAFRQRFSMEEKTAIELASLDNPTAPDADRQQAAALRAYLGDLAVATFIDLSRADTVAGVQQLEIFGVIAEGRAEVILNTPASWSELPQDQQRVQGM